MTLVRRFALTAALLGSAVAPQLLEAQPLRFDAGFRSPASPTQSGWTAVNLNGINGVTFTGVGGVFLDDRDRGAGANSAPASTFDDLWRDFIFADERSPANVSEPILAGMDITIANLMPNTVYSVSLWAFDSGSSGSRNMTWNGVQYGFDGTGVRPDGLTDRRVDFTTVSNGAGVAVLEGRIGAPRGSCCNVFVNGFELTAQSAQVPEPTSLALLGIGATLIGLRIRRRNSV